MPSTAAPDQTARARQVDHGLSALLILQAFTLFVAIPLGSGSSAWRMLLDGCHLAFALICIGVLTRHPLIRLALVAGVVLLVGGPPVSHVLGATLDLGATVQHEIIAFVAFAFNAVVTGLVARHVFKPGRVTGHRVRGAVLLYLNVAALFAIAYSVLATNIPGAFVLPAAAEGFVRGGPMNAIFSYFSLTTITTTGYGDITPVHPLARSLANLEAVIGQLFPATLLARLVSLNLAHEQDGESAA